VRHRCLKKTLQNCPVRLIEMAITGSLNDEAGRCNGGEGGCSSKNLAPYESSLRNRGNDWPPFGFTMVGHLRIQNVKQAIELVIGRKVEGAFAELGSWRGGVCIYARALLDVLGENERKVFVFDAFERIPGYGSNANFLEVSEGAVKHNFEKFFGSVPSSVLFYKGLFKNTVPNFAKTGEKISVLRIDGNYYDSYQDALYYLYPLVPVGGVVIFDDILSHSNVMRCWKDFKLEQHLPEEIIRIDDHSAWFEKTKDVEIDFKYFRKPQDANL
jgi:hypothetical protein